MPSWIQHPVTGKLIPREEYVRPNVNKSAAVMDDVKPFISTVDGSLIGTRPQLEEHNRRHNVTNTADFPREYVAERGRRVLRDQARADKADRIQTMIKAGI